MSINKLISIRNPVIDAITLLGLDHDKDMPALTRWAELAELEIGSRYQYERKRVVLDITGCSACLPTDAMKLERAILGDHGCDCEDLFATCITNGSIYNDQSNQDLSGFLIVDLAATTGSTQGYGIVMYEIQDNKILFMNDYDGQKVTIQYLGLVTDCDGFMMVGQNHVRAITAYLMYMNMARKKRKTGNEMQEMIMWRNEWNLLCSHARADDAELTETDRMAISDMVNDPFAGVGLWKGMRTTLGFSGVTF